MTSLNKIYSSGEKPEYGFLLPRCSAFCYISNSDKYSLKGHNLIVGASEIILHGLLGMDVPRMETVVTPCMEYVKKISADKFIEGLESYSFIINISTVLAMQVLATNKIIKKSLDNLHEHDREIQNSLIMLYNLVNDLSREFDKRKLAWVKELFIKRISTINYKRGEALARSSDSITIDPSTELSENVVEFHRGDTICEENTKGEELYILQGGSLDVEIGGNKVAVIEEKGTIIGEMALLLNENRTATLRAKNNAVVSIVKKSELKNYVEKQPDLLKKIAAALAKRHYYNILKIEAVNKSIIERDLGGEERSIEKKLENLKKIKREVSKLKNEISDVAYKKDADFLKELLEKYE